MYTYNFFVISAQPRATTFLIRRSKLISYSHFADVCTCQTEFYCNFIVLEIERHFISTQHTRLIMLLLRLVFQKKVWPINIHINKMKRLTSKLLKFRLHNDQDPHRSAQKSNFDLNY